MSELDFASSHEGLYAIERRLDAGRTLGGVAIHQSEFLGLQELEKEDYMPFKIHILSEPISNVLTKESNDIVFEYPTEKIWNPDGVSVKNRVEKDPLLLKRIETALKPDNLKRYITLVDPTAPTRCIDGRIRKGWAKLSEVFKRALGAKVAGGTAHAALAHRIVDAENLKDDLLFENDITFVIERFQQLGISIGGHVDDHAKEGDTGCGAVDKINLILEKLQSPEPQEQLRGLARTIMGKGYDGKGIANEVIGRMLYLDAIKPTYMPKENNDPNGKFLYKQRIVELMRKRADQAQEAVPELEGPHKEVAVILNFVRGTTFDTDQFSFDNDNEIQVFGWDIWEMYEEAERLYPSSMQEPPEDQAKASAKRMKYVTTRTLLGIATTMVLTDGSLKVVMVQPEAETTSQIAA
jgi:hypothetical protein